jgi:hypothetical protein
MTVGGRKIANDGTIGGRGRGFCRGGKADGCRRQTSNYDRSHCGISFNIHQSFVLTASPCWQLKNVITSLYSTFSTLFCGYISTALYNIGHDF